MFGERNSRMYWKIFLLDYVPNSIVQYPEVSHDVVIFGIFFLSAWPSLLVLSCSLYSQDVLWIVSQSDIAALTDLLKLDNFFGVRSLIELCVYFAASNVRHSAQTRNFLHFFSYRGSSGSCGGWGIPCPHWSYSVSALDRDGMWLSDGTSSLSVAMTTSTLDHL